MEIEKIKKLPKSFLKEAMGFLFKIEKLRKINKISGINFNDAEKRLAEKIDNYRTVEKEAIHTWKIVELSRNEDRPQTIDYINSIFEDFIFVSGDRLSMDDKSIIAGFGKLKGHTVAVIGHNKGKDIKQKVEYNFGYSMPQGYRKAMRVMELADRFGFPVITLIDTPGAYPALDAEDQGQASAIANSILKMFELNVPTITVLIGEGGSGGALALSIGNYVMILENSTYSVITPEGCASILWRDPSVAKLAARAMKLTSRDLLKLGVVDKIIYEPMGGAQNNPERMIRIVKGYVAGILLRYMKYENPDFKKMRAEKYESIGYTIGG
jgi:acetyl-CoA carboxylase carboxyl transferase subunit alpha